ncbi:hypothetical protein P167DRAFT_131706 [Morchella conica CCBAS932]|uniref:Uncharacterized protein n=1 Tax=Morchella conica CCBAS932 TaxID=1392247 RepID=A0A3N4KUF2_9PEZI|nr:hypothetical protein P167DRAFT_131706 [Morchella conica CCBAS932]
MMIAVPLFSTLSTTTPSTSTPLSTSACFKSRPNSSPPTHPTILTTTPSPESRAAAAAWFAPLPPGAVLNDFAVRVSPGAGRRRVRVTRSVLREPIMVMFLGLIFWFWSVWSLCGGVGVLM